MNQVWWNGPEFLVLPTSDWPNLHELDDAREAESELIKEAPVILHTFAITRGRTTLYKLQVDCNNFSLVTENYSLCDSFCQKAAQQDKPQRPCNKSV